ncbi:MAG: argininosuccinate lyase [Elusimicrobia bacterium]|nr:argininosuccinate lyase [Candidatus Liberimonas magnetica]
MDNKAKTVQDFVSSFSYDQRLAVFDVIGSIAHVRMLVKSKIIPAGEGKKIIKGLNSILIDINKGKKLLKEEDVHYAVEKELIKRIGVLGGKMHTARSRNDQVALDIRMYIRNEIRVLIDILSDLEKSIAAQAAKNIKAVMPGYTHMQHAQPVLFSHHILSYAWMFERDKERLKDCLKRVNILPLGSAALAGTSFNIDRNYVARMLSFDGISLNSIDAVSDRDFIIEFISDLSIIATHLSRLSEELIIWSSSEFDFIKLPDAFTTGSSIMPQKRNPDVAELIRAKTGKVYGDLMAILTIMKALPLAYNRDMQEDKPILFNAFDTVMDCLNVMIPMVSGLEIKPGNMSEAAKKGFLCATELADFLVRKGMPFRTAHGIIKNLVNYCIKRNKDLIDLSANELKTFSKLFNNDVHSLLKPENTINLKKSIGGTSSSSVKNQISSLRKILKKI